jgi:carbamoyltransferase
LGFVPRNQEHKVQWLSLGGEPAFKGILLELMREPGNPMPRLNRGLVDRDATGCLKLSERFYSRAGLTERGAGLGEVRQALASSLQHACFEIVRDLLRHFQRIHGAQNICLGGGLFQNVLLVAELEKEFGMNRVFVAPAPGNAGCAVGAGLYVWHQLMKKARSENTSHVYWGPAYKRHEIEDVLTNSKARYSSQTTDERRLDAAIQLLQNGKIIGWFQGAAEFGPRALGNRSLLASPWAQYVKENLNDYIKHREWFRPFALAVPEEDCARYFECSNLCRFMSSLANVLPGVEILPEGFTLPGNQVRLQVVEKRANPLFWQLLKRFGTVAPAPILINTSFNMAGEALVAKPEDALRSYFCSGIDALVIERFVLSKYPIGSTVQPGLVGKAPSC